MKSCGFVALIFLLSVLQFGCVRNGAFEANSSLIDSVNSTPTPTPSPTATPTPTPAFPNSAPTEIFLSANFLSERAGINAVVGTLRTDDSDVNDSYTYTLVTGTGDTDNAEFNILGDQLRKNYSAHQSLKDNYVVRIRSTDSGGLSVEKSFPILILSIPDDHFKLGVNADNWSNEVDQANFLIALRKLDVDFIVWHLSPEEENDSTKLMKIVNFCRANNFGYLFNTAAMNETDGVAEFTQGDGTYRWDILTSVMTSLQYDSLFLGVVYQEPLLMQSFNNSSLGTRTILPYFVDTENMVPLDAFTAVKNKITTLKDYYATYSKRLLFEMAMPDEAHVVSAGGALLVPKFMQEGYNDLMFYMFASAARQYNQSELWACLDLWYLGNFPDKGIQGATSHTPTQLYDSLVYAYQKGIDYTYVENINGLVDRDNGFSLTTYGQKIIDFQSNRKNLSRASWKTYTPTQVVRRFPDGYWGQQYSSVIFDQPYGSHRQDFVKHDGWLPLLNTLTSGKIPASANNWNALLSPYYSVQPYELLAGLPAMLIFDHTADNSSLPVGITLSDLWSTSQFTCPNDYVLVPFNAGVGTNQDFCVSKYEMRNVSGKPRPRADGTLWVNINQTDAKAACTSLGAGYHLITNSEWMTIARNIEAVGANWSSGTIGVGNLSTGYSQTSNVIYATVPISDVTESVVGIQAPGTNGRRVHKLSNNNYIWDLAGNVLEWVDWNQPSDKADASLMNWIELSASTPTTTMTSQTYKPAGATNSTNGMGKYYPGNQDAGGAALRGGSYELGDAAGIYNLKLVDSSTQASALIGFRCVFQP